MSKTTWSILLSELRQADRRTFSDADLDVGAEARSDDAESYVAPMDARGVRDYLRLEGHQRAATRCENWREEERLFRLSLQRDARSRTVMERGNILKADAEIIPKKSREVRDAEGVAAERAAKTDRVSDGAKGAAPGSASSAREPSGLASPVIAPARFLADLRPVASAVPSRNASENAAVSAVVVPVTNIATDGANNTAPYKGGEANVFAGFRTPPQAGAITTNDASKMVPPADKSFESVQSAARRALEVIPEQHFSSAFAPSANVEPSSMPPSSDALVSGTSPAVLQEIVHTSSTTDSLPTAIPVDASVSAEEPAEKERQIVQSSIEHNEGRYAHYTARAASLKTAFRQLETDPALKSLKSAVMFASSNPVVICSANSPLEIIEPYRKAFLLLRGVQVETNSIPVKLSDHPEIVSFVRHNMARKFVDLAGLQVEEKNEVKLFALASLLTELWACDLEFGEVFLALLFTEYPALVPKKEPIKSEGNVEAHLKKLGALTKFYAAVMQTDRIFLLKRLFPAKTFNPNNPHGSEAAWQLLTGIVNGPIQVGVTVLVLRNLLSVAGWLLSLTYGKQFTKVMKSVSLHVLPLIRSKTPAELSGPVDRLAELISNFHQTGSIPVPANRLSQEFWMTR